MIWLIKLKKILRLLKSWDKQTSALYIYQVAKVSHSTRKKEKDNIKYLPSPTMWAPQMTCWNGKANLMIVQGAHQCPKLHENESISKSGNNSEEQSWIAFTTYEDQSY